MSRNIITPKEAVSICRKIRNSCDRDFITQRIPVLLSQPPMGFHDVTEATLWRARKTDEAHPEETLIISRMLSALLHNQPKPDDSIMKACLYCTHLSTAIMVVFQRLVPYREIRYQVSLTQNLSKNYCGFVGDIVKAHKWNSEDFTLVQKHWNHLLKSKKPVFS